MRNKLKENQREDRNIMESIAKDVEHTNNNIYNIITTNIIEQISKWKMGMSL